ncbi:MAG: Carboxyl transferase [Anaerolinea thermophila]|uniref:Carboxyl transferase n=1 Tax=Anaerolinea thermophila TaxID=167964 RepID=A0A101FYJ5_9CHLR|nr:MAG: Carboxyl transferase [Anaerolinea thermophila]
MNNESQLKKLAELQKRAKAGGGEKRIDKQHQKGKLTARERLDELLDPGSFREIGQLITARDDNATTQDEKYLGDGVVTGYGLIDGRTVFVYAQDFTVMGGALGEMQSAKICRVMDLAYENGAPIIGLIDSGGARIQEGVYSLGGYGEIFRRNALYSGIIPQISIILGPCAGGAAYSPALTDLIIMVEKQSYMFLTGPSVIKTVTGEEVDFENLGGADVHLAKSGIASLTAKTESDALRLCRAVLHYLPANNAENPPFTATTDSPVRMDSELDSIIPADAAVPYNMHEVIQRIVDQKSFLELQSTFAPNAVIGFARMDGNTIGIVAQEPNFMAGVLDIDASDKICRFVRFCDCFNIPIITFVDSPGFLPGVNQEHHGIIRHGAKVLFAYSESTVPKVSVVTRKAYGGAYIVMSSKYLGTDFTFAWPSAEIAVMGPEGAANILYGKQIEQSNDPDKERAALTEQYKDKFLNPYAAAQAGHIDEVLEPRKTRPAIISALQTLYQKQVQHPQRKHGNSPV